MGPRPGGEGDERPLLEVGRIARPHGLDGEVVVALSTNRTERLAPGSELTCQLVPVVLARDQAGEPGAPGSGDPPGADSTSRRMLVVLGSKPFQGRYLVEFDGVHTREAADELRGALLLARAVEDPEALFVHDLVGSEVVEVDGTLRGRVVALQANPASDLLVMEEGHLVPLRFVVGREQGRIVVDAPAGLFE